MFFEQCIAYWINRPILDASDSIPMSTCLPISNKLYVDADMKIGVCEKMADCYQSSIFVKPEVSVLSGGASTSDEISACINAQENEKKNGESPKRGTSVAEEG